MNPEKEPRQLTLFAGLALGGIWLLQAVVNWLWLSANSTITGWDVPGHLVSSYAYYQLLETWSLQTPFQIMTLDSYRPPLFNLSPAPLFWLFGRTADVAVLVNLVYLAILIGSVYGIGNRLSGRGAGLFAAFLASIYPMLFAMTRLLYIDYALTAVVALSVYLLVRSEGLRHRGWSTALGLSLGWGMLIKWTHPIFVLPPLVVVAYGTQGSAGLREEWASLRPPLRRTLPAAAVAMAAVLLWYLPNLQEVRGSTLGWWILPITWVLLTSTAALALSPGSRLANGLLVIFLGMSIASVWYLPQIDFLRTLFLVGYGKPYEAIWGFSYYFRTLVNEQLSPLLLLALLGAVSALLMAIVRRRLPRHERLALWMLAAWLIVPMLLLSWKTTTVDSRYTMPLLPPLALLTAQGLLSLRRLWLRRVLVGALVVGSLFQFAALSFDSLAWLSREVKVAAPFLVEVGPLARGRHLQWPDSGPNDHRYWVLPAILDGIEAERRSRGQSESDVGLLVNSPQINDSICYYLMAEAYPTGKYRGLRIHPLARRDLLETSDVEPSTYEQLFSMDYVILKKGSRWGLRPSAIQAMDRLDQPDDPFYSTFVVLQEHVLPDGDRAMLFRKRRQ